MKLPAQRAGLPGCHPGQKSLSLYPDDSVMMGQLISQAKDKTRQNFIDYREKFADLMVKRQK
jgi:hypothetical protein